MLTEEQRHVIPEREPTENTTYYHHENIPAGDFLASSKSNKVSNSRTLRSIRSPFTPNQYLILQGPRVLSELRYYTWGQTFLSAFHRNPPIPISPMDCTSGLHCKAWDPPASAIHTNPHTYKATHHNIPLQKTWLCLLLTTTAGIF